MTGFRRAEPYSLNILVRFGGFLERDFPALLLKVENVPVFGVEVSLHVVCEFFLENGVFSNFFCYSGEAFAGLLEKFKVHLSFDEKFGHPKAQIFDVEGAVTHVEPKPDTCRSAPGIRFAIFRAHAGTGRQGQDHFHERFSRHLALCLVGHLYLWGVFKVIRQRAGSRRSGTGVFETLRDLVGQLVRILRGQRDDFVPIQSRMERRLVAV